MKHQFKCILNSILQQHSYYTVKLLDIYGILDIDSVTEYADYASNKDKNCKLIILGNSIFVACQRNLRENTEIMVIASLTTKSFWNISYYAHGKLIKTIPLSNVEEDCIDLSESGQRWEGQAYEKKPCGWGSYYNEENILVYRGFAFQDNWIGYGIEYWNDIQQPIPKYDGSFCFGMKFGKGKVYDRKGKYLGKRGYLNDEVCENIVITVPNQTIDTLFHNTLMSVFIIGDECYPHHSSFILSGYPYLTTVRIGNNCYTTSEHKHCRFCITNCNLLKRVEIGDDSFSFFDSCIFRNLAALEYCSFGKLQDSCHSFENCKELIFQSNLF